MLFAVPTEVQIYVIWIVMCKPEQL